ncbi:MAG: hypothetical protein MHM6MM_005383 [Cercozoa sp. M6MM]
MDDAKAGQFAREEEAMHAFHHHHFFYPFTPPPVNPEHEHHERTREAAFFHDLAHPAVIARVPLVLFQQFRHPQPEPTWTHAAWFTSPFAQEVHRIPRFVPVDTTPHIWSDSSAKLPGYPPGTGDYRGTPASAWLPPCEIRNSDKMYQVFANCAAADPQSIKVQVHCDSRQVEISGSSKHHLRFGQATDDTAVTETAEKHTKPEDLPHFRRVFQLPSDVQPQGVAARLDKYGVLHVYFVKSETPESMATLDVPVTLPAGVQSLCE